MEKVYKMLSLDAECVVTKSIEGTKIYGAAINHSSLIALHSGWWKQFYNFYPFYRYMMSKYVLYKKNHSCLLGHLSTNEQLRVVAKLRRVGKRWKRMYHAQLDAGWKCISNLYDNAKCFVKRLEPSKTIWFWKERGKQEEKLSLSDKYCFSFTYNYVMCKNES